VDGARVRDLEEVYRLRCAQFLRVATAIGGDEDAGHEAVQEGFSDALRHRRSFRGEGPLEAWVWRAVVNAAHRARSKRPLLAPFPHEEPATNGQPNNEGPVRAWLAALPERQRMTVFLRYYADLDYRTIASVLEIEVGTVSATLSAALTSLPRSNARSTAERSAGSSGASRAVSQRATPPSVKVAAAGSRGSSTRTRTTSSVSQSATGPSGGRAPRRYPDPPSVITRSASGSSAALGSAWAAETGNSSSSAPLELTWGFSGGGQQFWIVSGVASDAVARIEVFLGNGERWRAPLRDNATAFRVQRAKFPVRIVGYDAAGRVIDVKTIRG